MNKLRYRIVFNKARGMCMAVAETTRSRTKAAGQGVVNVDAHVSARIPTLRRMVLLFGIGLGGLAAAGSGIAQVVADAHAPGSQRATVLNAANGVVQVNIQTPSSAGVSRNLYSQFDVPKSGAILNNSRTNVQSQLGGWVQGNPWLSTGTARVILNEVNSSNPSRLQGYIEVAGDRAETIIANPAGIAVDGGGFINVSRATLTTGSPILQDGVVKGYSVQRGQIVIDGAGLDASKTDYTALIARSLQVNAGLQARHLTVITGVNEVDAGTQAAVTQVNQAVDAPPLYAVDVARLGGMYANQIFLVGTEAGVGVRNAGTIGAASGDLVVTASGRLENSGALSASKRLQLNASRVDSQGSMQAGSALALTAGSLRNGGLLNSGTEALIIVQGEVDNSGGHIEAVRIDLTGATLRNAHGSIAQTGAQTLAVDAAQVINSAGTFGQQSLPAATGTGTTAAAESGTASPVDAGAAGGTGSTAVGGPASAPVFADGRLQLERLDNASGMITANGETVLSTAALDNRGGQAYLGSLSVSGPSLDNTAGTLTILRNFDARTERFVNDQGKVLVGATFNGALGSFSNRQGLLQAQHLSVDVTGQPDTPGGPLRPRGIGAAALPVGGQLAGAVGPLETHADLRLHAGAVSGSGSTVNVAGNMFIDSGTTSTAKGRWTIGGSANLRTGDLDNSGGAISAANALDLTSGALTNVDGKITSGSGAAITANGDVDNSGGAIQAARDLMLRSPGLIRNRAGDVGTLGSASMLSVTGAAIDNGDGRISNSGTGRTALAASSIMNSGLIGGHGEVEIVAHELRNQAGGSVVSLGDLTLLVDTALDNAGRIESGGRLRLAQDAAQLNNSGTLAALGDIEIAAASVDNTSGSIATVAGSGSQLSLKAATLENRAGVVQADGTARLEIRGGIGNVNGHLRAGAGMFLTAGERLENRGGSIESVAGMLVHGAQIGNDGGTIAAAGTQASIIEADRNIDNNGLIGANGQLTLRAQTFHNGAVGTVSAIGDLELVVRDAVANSGGMINTLGMLNYHQAQSTLINSGTITAVAGVGLTIDQVDNRGGAINSVNGASLALKAHALDNRGGRLMAEGDAAVRVSGNVDNGGGVIEALGEHGTLALRAAAIDNAEGRIAGIGDGATIVSAAGHIASSGLIAGNGALYISAASLDNAGTISSSAQVELAAGSALNNCGTISAAAGLHTHQVNAALRNSGTIVAGGLLEMTLGTLDNSGGRIATAVGSNTDILLSAQEIGNRDGAITANRNATLLAIDSFDGRGGLLQAGEQLRLNAGGLINASGGRIETLATDSTLELHAGALLNEAGRIVNAGNGDTRVHAETTLINSGELSGKGRLSLEALSTVNNGGGNIVSGGALLLQSRSSFYNAGAISSSGGLTMDQAGASLANHGTIVANADIAIRASAIDNDEGTIATASGSSASLALQGASLSNRGGRIVAERNMTLGVDGAVDNSHGRISGINIVQATSGATLTNLDGVIEASGPNASLTLKAQNLQNGDGRIVNVGQGSTTISVADSLVNSGLVAGNGTLALHSSTLVNERSGTMTFGGVMTAAVSARLENAGTVNSGAALEIAALTADVRNSGLVVANGALDLASAAFNNNGGQLATAQGSGAGLQVNAASISNRGGSIQSDRHAQVNSEGAFDNTQGTLQATGSLRLNAAGAAGNDGGVIEALDPAAELSVHAGALDNGNGQIVNVGSGTTSLAVDDKITNRGLIAGNGSVDLALGELDNQANGSIVSGSFLHVGAAGAIGNAGTISSRGSLTVDSKIASVANRGTIVSGGGSTINAASFDNNGGQLATVKDGGGSITLNARDISNVAGAVMADGAVRIAALGTIDNHQGTVRANTALDIDAAGALGNQGGVIEVANIGGTLDMRARSIDNSAGRLVNAGRGATRITATESIVNGGTLAGNGSVDLSASNLHNDASGLISAGAALDLHVGDELDNAGKISAGRALGMDQAGARIANSGQIVAAGRLALHGASIANDGGQIGTLSGAEIVLNSESMLSNRAGVIGADGNAVLSAAGTFDNTLGQVQTSGQLQISVAGAMRNAGGTLESVGTASTLTLQAASIENTAGHIVNTGAGQTTINSATDILNSGTIGGNGAFAISAQDLLNMSTGSVVAGGTLELAVSGRLNNAGAISSGAALHSNQAAESLVNTGKIGASGDIDITASAIINQGGQLYTVSDSGAAIKLTTASLDNMGGTVSADGLLKAGISFDAFNNGGTLHGGTGVALIAGGALTNGSGNIETAAGTLAVQAQSIDSSGRIVNGGRGQTSIDSATAIVNSGTLVGNGALALTAQSLQNSASGAIGSGSELELAVHRQMDNAGMISSGGTLRFDQAAASFGNTGRIGARGSIDISAGIISNLAGQLSTVDQSGAAIALRAESLNNTGGAISADGVLRAEIGDRLINDDGTLHGGTGATLTAGGLLANGGGIIEAAAGALSIDAQSIDSSGRIVNAGSGQTTIGSAMAIVNSGTIAGAGAFVISAQTLQNTDGGAIGSGATMSLALRQQLDNSGIINSRESLSFDQAAASISNKGHIEAGGPIDITAAAIANRGGQLYTVSSSGAAIGLSTGSLDNTGGAISASGMLQVALANGMVNDGGTLHGGTGAALIAGGALANGRGTVETAAGALDIHTHSLDNIGRIVNAGSGPTTIDSTTEIVNGGTIAGNGALALSAQVLQNKDTGTIESGAGLDLAVRQQLDNAGTISSLAGLHFNQAASGLTNTGRILAGGLVDISAATISNRNGLLYTANQSGASIQLQSVRLDNMDGTISADGLLAAVLAEGMVNDGGTVHGGTGLTLDVGTAIANGSGTIESAAGRVDIRAQSISSSGRIVNAGIAQTTINSATGIANSGTIAGNGALMISGQTLQNTSSGAIGSGSVLELAVLAQIDNAGTINSGDTLHFDQSAAGFSNTGRIGARGNVDIAAGTISNKAGLLFTANQSGAAISLNANSLDNTGGTVSADALLHAEIGGGVANDGGTLHGGTSTALNAAGTIANGSGTIEAAAGTLGLQAASIDSSGHIVNAGIGATTIAATTSILNSGLVAGNGALVLAAHTLVNTGAGAIGSGAALELAVRQQLDNAGAISSAEGLQFNQAAASFRNAGSIGAGSNIDITAAVVNNMDGVLYTVSGSATAIHLNADNLDNTGGMVSADGLLRAIVAGDAANSGGTLHGGSGAALNLGGALANGDGTIQAASGALDIQAQSIDSSGRIVNAGIGATSIGSSAFIVNSGTIVGNGQLSISADTLENKRNGAIGSGIAAALDLAVRQNVTNAGVVSSGGSLHFDTAAASISNTGIFGAVGAIDITAAALSNKGGQLYTVNNSGAGINLNSGSLDNTGGSVSADGLLNATVSGNVDNRGGSIHGGAGATLAAGGTLANQGGTVEAAAGTLLAQAASIDNTAGHIVNAGSGATTISSVTDLINGGTIGGNGTVTVSAQSLQNASNGVIGSGSAMDLEVRQQLINAGTISSVGNMHFDQAAASFRNAGRIGAAGTINISAATIDNRDGQLYTLSNSGAAIDLKTDNLDNSAGIVSANGVLRATVDGDARNSDGALHGEAGATLSVGGALLNGSGTIQAASNALEVQAASVDSSGRIVNAGTGQTSIHSTAGIANSGIIASTGALAISAQTLQNATEGTIGTGSGAGLELAVGQQLTNAGTISSGGILHVDQAAVHIVNTGVIGAAGNVEITAGIVDNAGGQLYTAQHSGAAIALHSDSLDNTGGTIAADGLLGIESRGAIFNNAGTLHGGAGATVDTSGALANGSGTIQVLGGGLEIRAQSVDSAGRIVNGGAGSTSVSSAGAIVNSGTIAGNGNLDLHASVLENQAIGQIMSGRALLLDARQQLTNAGTVSSGGTLTFDQGSASFANSGQIAAAGDIRLTAASIDNNGGRISTVRGSGADITLTTSSLSNRSGAILADGDAIMSIAGPADNSHGTLQAGASLILATSGDINNGDGVIEALGSRGSMTLESAAIDNGSGRISNAGNGDTRLLSQTSISNGGIIAAMGNLLLAGQTVSNQAGATVASGNNLALALSRELGNHGKINSAGTLTFDQAGATFTNNSEVYSGGNAFINARLVNNDGGRLGTGSGSGADLILASQQLSNQGGRIAADRDLMVGTHSVTALGELFGGRDLALAMDGDYVQSGGVQQFRSNRNLSLLVTGNITNNSTLEAAGTLALSGQQISNQAGAAIEGREVLLMASRNLANAGEIKGAETLGISAANVSNSGGIVGRNVAVATGNLDNTGPNALIGATGALGLGVAGILNNIGGATLYSSGDMTIGGRDGASAGAVNNISSTIEAAGSLALNAGSLSNVRENVQIVKVNTVDETVHMDMPSWYQYGDNHSSFETSAANYRPHEVYFVSPSDILEDQVYVTPDGFTIHRAVVRTHANDSAFYIAASGLYTQYGQRSRLILSDDTRVIYYTESAQVANPDQGAPSSNAIVLAETVINWSGSITFSNQYGSCSSDCIRLITEPGYTDPRTTRLRDTMRALEPEKSKLEVSADAHHVAVEDQLAPGSGASAQILSGGNMHLTVTNAFENRFGDIKARGSLLIDGGAAPNNVGATLYRTHTFDGTWRTYGGATVAYQRPSISEVIGSTAGVIDGLQGVTIVGRSFSNVDVTAGTVGNIRDAVNVIGSGASGASSAGAHVKAHDNSRGAAGVQVSAEGGLDGTAGANVAVGSGIGAADNHHVAALAHTYGAIGTHIAAGTGIDDAAPTRIDAGTGVGGLANAQVVAGSAVGHVATIAVSAGAGAGGTAEMSGIVEEGAESTARAQLSRSVIDVHPGLDGTVGPTGDSSVRRVAFNAAASGVSNLSRAGGQATGSGYVNTAEVDDATLVGGMTNGLTLNGTVTRSGAINDGRLSGIVAGFRNSARLGEVHPTDAPAVGHQVSNAQGAALGSVTKVAPSGLFIRNPDPNGNYLLETRPQFANQQQWTSSDYLLQQLAFEPATTQKRLGDGFYEQRLVREQLAELTGHTLYSGASDDSTYKQLLTNAVSFAQEFGLRPGIALSAEQVSHLTSDIAWMENQTVMLPDGTTETVLVPKVYLAHIGEHALQPGGALVTGNGVTIKTTESIVNSGGVIDGGNGRTLFVAGENIVNQGGTIKGGTVTLAADRDVRNESLAVTEAYDFGQNRGSHTSLSNQASITATGALDIMAGRDLSDLAGKITAGNASLTAGQNIDFATIRTGSTYQSQIGGITENDSSITHQLSKISTAGNLKIAATGDLNLTGTQVSIGTGGSGNGELLAGKTINIAAVTNEVNTSLRNDPGSKQYDKQVHQNQIAVGAGIAAAGSLTVGAGILGNGAINITGSSVAAVDGLKLTAADSINILSMQEQHLSDTASTRSSGGLLKSKTVQQADYVASSQAIGSALSGKTVEITAGKEINVLGSAIVGEGDVNLAALGSVNIDAATNTLTEQHHTQVKESGFLSGGSFGISYGTRTTTTDQSRDATTQSGQSRSMVGSIDGNLNVAAGDALKIIGSDLSAGKDMTLTGRSVVITPGTDDVNSKLTSKMTQDGFTLAIGGSVVNAIQNAQSMGTAAGQTSVGRLKALATASAAMTANDTVKDLAANGPSARISLTVGHSESESTEVTASRTHGGSTLAAGNNVTIAATGGGEASNIDIIGSDLRAKGNVSLAADNKVNLLAAQDTESQHSQSKSWSAAIGVAAELSSKFAYGVTASVSASRGNVDGEATAQIDSHVIAGDRLTIASGGDTNLKGAVASGRQVVADIKGNLHIESLQDSATLDGKRSSASVSGTVGGGISGFSASVSQSKVHNDYASVQEQSGIRTGDGGFQVQVAGNTDLKGAVISSSEQAIKDGRNSLTTATLSSGDIENRDSHDASGVSLGVNVGKNQSGDTFSPSMAPGIGQVSGSQSSVTRSGVSDGTLTVAGEQPGQAVVHLNRDVSTGKETAQALTKGWTGAQALDEVGAQMKITSAALPRLANAIGDYAKDKVTELKAKGNAEEAAKWAEGGIYRVAAHAALGAMGGGVGGAIGATAAAEAAPALDKMQDAMKEELASAGLSTGEAKLAAKLIAGGTAAAIGGVVGKGAGAATALNADANNRQLHIAEVTWIKNNATKFADDRNISVEEATKRLAQQASKDVDLVWRGVLPDTEDNEAKAFLALAKGETFTNSFGQKQNMFSTQDGQFTAAQNGLFESDMAFVLKYVTPYANRAALTGVRGEIGQIANNVAETVKRDPYGVAKEVGISLWKGAREIVSHPLNSANEFTDSIVSGTKSFGEGVAASTNEDIQHQLNSLYGQNVIGAIQIATSAQGAMMLGSALGAGKVGSKAVSVAADAVGTVGKVNPIFAKLLGGVDASAKIPLTAGIDPATRDLILDIPKGARPEPSTYIQSDIIKAHLEKFEGGASYLVPKDTLDRWGRDILGYADNTQFVMPKAEMDRMLAGAKGDISIVEAQLGVPAGSWVGKEMVRIDIPEPTKLGVRLPSGNEAGANKEWLPGGRLPTGLPEAVIDSIPKGKYKEVPLWH
jgi:filamentous hemagglutinin